MIVHPHPDLVNAYDPQYGIARLSDRREQITTVAIRLWNADHDYLQGVNRKLWDMNMDEGGIPADVQRRYVKLAMAALGYDCTSKDGKAISADPA
jgi:hypothetical protein